MSLGIKIKTAAGYVFETVVNLCALVNGGQHLFSLRTSAGWCVCVFFLSRFGSVGCGLQPFRKGSLVFLGAVKI